LQDSLGASESLYFKVKKLLNGLKDLNIVRSGDPKLKEQTVAAKKCFATTIARNTLLAKDSPPTLIRH
jgi:hypothetical protein